MSDLEQARALIKAAERDLSALRGMGNAGVFADEVFGFHVQQAVEKSFKAWLAVNGLSGGMKSRIGPVFHRETHLLKGM